MVQSIPMQTAILGFGNPVMADDGVGVYVAQQLQERLGEQQHCQVFDMGTSAFEVLYKLRDHERIILVDAVVNTNDEVGSIYRLPASEVEEEIEDDPLVFLHGLKWHQALSYARKILGDDYPTEIEVYLISIEDTRFNVGISEDAKKGAERVIDLLIERLKTENV